MNVRLQYTFNFTAGVHYMDQLIMNNYTLRLYMITNTTDSDSTTVAFDRVKCFIGNEMESTVFINRDNVDACQKYLAAGMKITTMPNEPVDQIIGVMLFHKLNAIMEGRMSILENELASQIGDNMFYIHSENEITSEFAMPTWWTSPDLVHYDIELIDQEKVVALHRSGEWRELDLAWPDDKETESGNTIVFANFSKDETK